MAKDDRDWREKQDDKRSKEENNRSILTWAVAVLAAIVGGIVGRFIH